MIKIWQVILLSGIVIITFNACTPQIADTRMVPPPEKNVKVQKNEVLFSALANYYGHHSIGQIDYETAFNQFNSIIKNREQQAGVALFYLGLESLKGLNSQEVDFWNAMYLFEMAAKKIAEDLDNTDGNRSLVLALMYQYGFGLEQNLDKVLPFLVEAEKSGNHFATLIMAEFLLENSQFEAYRELAKKKLFKAMQYGFPQAYYLAYAYFPSLEGEKNLEKSALGLCPEAIIDVAERNGNKLAINAANTQAMKMGSALAIYNLSKTAGNDIEKIYFLKQAALRGCYEAIVDLADYYENHKLWSKAIVYNLYAARNEELQLTANLALERLDSISGLNVLLKELWKERHFAELNSLDSDCGFFVNSFKNNAPNLRESYWKYLQLNADKAFMNCDWYYIFVNNMPMEYAGDIFKRYYELLEPDSSKIEPVNNYFFAYAVAAGLAGQGELQLFALNEIKQEKLSSEMQLALEILRINGNILAGKREEAEDLLKKLSITDADKTFVVNFINGCAIGLLLNRQQTASVLQIELDKLLESREIKKQSFFNFKTGRDFLDIMYEEPEL
jgi:hypothetical protein